MATEALRTLLETAFPDATELDVADRTGGGDHFQVIVTAPSLTGLSLVEQHRRVYQALAALFETAGYAVGWIGPRLLATP